MKDFLQKFPDFLGNQETRIRMERIFLYDNHGKNLSRRFPATSPCHPQGRNPALHPLKVGHRLTPRMDVARSQFTVQKPFGLLHKRIQRA